MTNEEQTEQKESVPIYPDVIEGVSDDGFRTLILMMDKKTTYEFKEKPFKTFKKIQSIVTDKKTGIVNSGDLITKLIAVSLIKPTLTDMEIDDLPASVALSMTSAIAKLYNLKNLKNDFS